MDIKNKNKRTVETLIVNTPSEASTDTYPTLLLLLLPLFYFLCCCWVDCLKTSAIQKWNWRFAENGRNIRTAEALIINIPSEASTENYPMLLLLMLLLPLFSFLCCFCVDWLKIGAIQKWNWRLSENGRNIRTAEALIVNMPLGDQPKLTLCCFCCCCSIFCAVSATIVWIKTAPLNF